MEKTVPVLTVLKNDMVAKIIFVNNGRKEEEQILQVGRDQECDLMLAHPGISNYHLQIRSIPSREKLFVTDLSSVHGTWVRDEKLEAGACVEVKEGDFIRIGWSTRLYRLNWIPLSIAYDQQHPLVVRMMEAQNQHESLDYGSSSEDEYSTDFSVSLAPSPALIQMLQSQEYIHSFLKLPKKKYSSYISRSRGISSSSSSSSSKNLSQGENNVKWTIVLDTSSLLHQESRKPLHLLRGLKGTHLVVPPTVLKELNETKRTWSLLFRSRAAEIASSALDWIQECVVDTKWWIQLQSVSEETAHPHSNAPTSEDQLLQFALLYRNRNICGKLVLLSNVGTLKIKAMAKGVICETPREFYESLKNPLSERFMWPGSLPIGRFWRQNPTWFPKNKNPTSNGESGAATTTTKGLKLIIAP